MDLILKKSFFLILSQGLARVLGFFYTIYLAKALAIDEFGLYSAALAYFSLASVIADFGFNRFLIREVSINKERLTEILFNVTSLRLTFATILFCIFTIGLYLFDKDILRSNLSILAIMAILPQAIALSLDAVFIALQKITFSAIATLVLSFFNCLLGVILVSQNFGSTGVISALIAAQLIYTLFLLLLLKKDRVRLFSKSTTNSLIKVLIGALPYGLLGIFGLIYFKIDTLMLSYMRGNFETGLSSASYKFLEAVILIQDIINEQFTAFGDRPWFITNIPGEIYIKKSWEQDPFVKLIYLPNSLQLGYKHKIESVFPYKINDNFVYDNKEISDEEFAVRRNENSI